MPIQIKMNNGTNETKDICKRCSHSFVDVDMSCGCQYHVSCIPLCFFTEPHDLCPTCGTSVTGMYLRPLQLNEIENTKHQTGNNDLSPSVGLNRKREMNYGTEEEGEEQNRNSPFLLWSNRVFEGLSDSDRLHFRTGRWSHDETVYVDQIIRLFDGGCLALPNGIKLNELLRDILLCKSSRLTKKMKNAKLSTKSYRIDNKDVPDHFFSHLSRAQENFLKTINSPSTRQVIHFNITRMWRIHFSNFCLQASYDKLSTKDWNASLEDMKERVKNAEEEYRCTKRMKKEDNKNSLNTSKEISNPIARPENVYSLPIVADTHINAAVDDFSIHPASMTYPMYDSIVSMSASDCKDLKPTKKVRVKSQCSTLENMPIYQHDEKDDFWIGIFDLDDDHGEEVNHKYNEDKSVESSSDTTKNSSSLCSETQAHPSDQNKRDKFLLSTYQFEDTVSTENYLERLMNYVETENFPFHYCDAWVPCVLTNDHSVCLNSEREITCTDSLTLVHAGDFKRKCTSSEEDMFLRRYSTHSKTLSFDVGQGLPGRVYSTGNAIWEHRIRDTDPNVFSDKKDDRILGIETVVALSVKSSKVGLMVVILHSLDHVDENPRIIEKLTAFLHQFDPQPTWSLDITLSEKSHSRRTSTKSSYSSSNKIFESNNQRTQITALEAVTLANLLAEYMPVDQANTVISSPTSMSPLSTFISLRLLLLRYPVSCSEADKALLVILKESYNGYKKTNMENSNIAHQLVRDWMHLKSNGSSYLGGDVMHLSTSFIFDTNPQSSDDMLSAPMKKPCTIPIRNLPPSVSSDFEKFKRW